MKDKNKIGERKKHQICTTNHTQLKIQHAMSDAIMGITYKALDMKRDVHLANEKILEASTSSNHANRSIQTVNNLISSYAANISRVIDCDDDSTFISNLRESYGGKPITKFVDPNDPNKFSKYLSSLCYLYLF